ncbi:HMG-box [Basidiobolus meristosporus CBS 931.73]|uniref:HMG-box n=1 Tax=Basidiobolus meristosporus CBS 931.73 TaxID=1314790 RepID=A0A1Y1YCT4_9FUNG|nr:HMG-box [Basidiobolus meristosporus CBS 931.73]|eukprot:ORX95809.1 HMG-box [Basidiobolus meristosporus CBS 931.73]
MLRVTRPVHIQNALALYVAQAQRGYATTKKVIKAVDEKLTPPKRPLTAYLHFHKEFLNSLTPDEKTDIIATSKLVGEKWQKLTEADKKRYQEIAIKDREAYETKHKQFMDSLSADDFVKLAQIRKLSKAQGKTFPKFRDPNAPRKPMTSYVHFLKDKYSEVSAGSSNTEIFRKIAQEWREIPESSKKHYEQLAADDKLRYEREIKEYMQ